MGRNRWRLRRGFGASPAAPVILSAASASTPENEPSAGTLVANQPCTWSKSGPDAALFTLVGDSWSLPAQDYESPAHPNNQLQVTWTATSISTGLTATQDFVLTVTNVDDQVPTLPGSQTVLFGAKTRIGLGGHALNYSGSGYLSVTAETNGSAAASTHWRIDDRNHLVPRNGATTTYSAAPPTYNGPYTLTVREYSDAGRTNATGVVGLVTVNIVPSAAHAREMYATPTNADTGTGTTGHQLARYLSTGSPLALGDTIWCRDGHLNPAALDYSIRPLASYPGSGRITIRSENPLGFKIGKLQFDSNLSGIIHYPIDLREVFFWCDDPTAYMASSGKAFLFGRGIGVVDCRFEAGSNIVHPEWCDGLRTSGTCTVTGNYFKNVSQAISLQFDPIDCVVTGNTFEGIFGDGCSGSWRGANTNISGNFGFNKNYVTGAHGDFIQHLGVFKTEQIGVGDGTNKVFTGTLSGAPVSQVVGFRFGEGMPATAVTINSSNKLAGSGIDTANSPIDKTTGAFTVTFTITPGAGVPVYLDHRSSTNGVEWEIGMVEKNIAVRNVGLAGQGDYQGLFMDDSAGTDRLLSAQIKNNIFFVSFANGLAQTRPKNSTISYNLALNDVGGDSGIVASTSILIGLGDNGTLDRNASNVVSIISQAGTVTQTPNPNHTVTKSEVAYATAFTNYARTGLTTRAAALAAFTPANLATGSGGLKNGDGTFNGALFPATTGNAVGAWNDGSVFEPSNPTWVAAHPPAT